MIEPARAAGAALPVCVHPCSSLSVMARMTLGSARLIPTGFLTLAIAAGGLAVSASAQQAAGDDDRTVSTGGLLATQATRGRNWRVGMNVNTLADSNFRLRPDGQEVSALRITPTLDAGAGLPVGRQQFFIGGLIGRDYFINNAGFNRNRWSAGAGVAWRLGSRCSGVIGAETQRQLVQVDEQAEFVANVQTFNTAAASANCETAAGLGFGSSVRHQNATNDTPRRAVFDFTNTTYAPRITYGNRTLGQFSLGASFGRVRFSQRAVPTPTGFVQDGISSLNGRLGYSRTLGSRLQVSAGVSYLKTTPKPAEVLTVDPTGQIVAITRETFSGTGYDVSLGYQPSSRLSVSIAADRGVNTGGNVGALFIIRQGVSADASYKIGPAITFGAGATRRTNDYRGSFQAPGEALLRLNDRYERVYTRLDYSPVRLYSIGLEVAHQRRKSNPSLFDFSGTTALLRLRVNLGRG